MRSKWLYDSFALAERCEPEEKEEIMKMVARRNSANLPAKEPRAKLVKKGARFLEFTVSKGDEVHVFKSTTTVSDFFGVSRNSIRYQLKMHGTEFEYKGYLVKTRQFAPKESGLEYMPAAFTITDIKTGITKAFQTAEEACEYAHVSRSWFFRSIGDNKSLFKQYVVGYVTSVKNKNAKYVRVNCKIKKKKANSVITGSPIRAFDKTKNQSLYFVNIHEAARYFGITAKNVRSRCNGYTVGLLKEKWKLSYVRSDKCQ